MILNEPPKNIIGILGSGFGLYGYLPAVAFSRDNSVILLEKDKHKFDCRPELSEFRDVITWLDTASFYAKINTLIVSIPPEGQFLAVKHALHLPNIRSMVLEKPLAINPQKSGELLNLLISSGKSFRIGYNFQYTKWGQTLLNIFNEVNPKQVKIYWHFLAHHYLKDLKNWKRYNSTGGGVIRFYGIHLIALLAQMGPCKVLSSRSVGYSDDDIYQWNARFEINSIHTIEIDIDSRANVNKFVVEMEGRNKNIDNEIQVCQNDPFDEHVAMPGNQDRRVRFITPVLDSLMEAQKQHYWNSLYNRINSLWEQTENVNIAEI